MAGMAASSADAAATKCTEILIEKIMKEFPYLCCYKSYAADFEKEKKRLKAAVDSVERKIKEAQKRNETQIDPIVKNWVEEANELIQQDTTPKKWSSRYSLAKELERMTQEIPTMMDKAENFSQVAHAAERPGVEFYSPDFKPFKSRDSKFEELLEQLKDGSKCRIGLQAMGGSGKTTMAKAIWKELENSKAFDKVIFIEVPNPVDEKKVRDEIEKKLDLETEDDKKKNLTQAEQIWIRIANTGNVLIILDDVWEELKLERIGIHHGIHNKGRCCVLLTTRYKTICTSMKCQKIIELEILPEEEAVDLFLYHASESGKDCPNKSKLLASKIVNHCGRLPVIVVALAKTFRNWDPNEWEDAFAVIEKDSSLRHENIDEASKFYNSLKISFELLDRGGQDVILLCSIFPRAYEIPVELLSEIAIGLGLCENSDSYYRARSQALLIKSTLVSSALLLAAREGYIKMHDVIRDVAQQIGDEKIQVIMDSKTKLKKNVKYSSWTIDNFSNYFEGNHLEVLLVWVNANGSLEVPDTFFLGVKGLRVLLLCSKFEFGKTHALSLPKSIHSLENIQTLSLTNWDLGDISILKNLKKLQTLELTNCSIIELPNDIDQLEKLKLLLLILCSIKRNNPFEVIGRCSKLEVLYYVSNDDSLNCNAKPSNITVPQEFEIYHIEGSSSECFFQWDASSKRYFNSTGLTGILSESTVKSLAARAEILELTGCEEARWTNLIPDMVHPKDGEMNDLRRLSLKSWSSLQCLVNTNGIPSDATIFSNLIELRLYDMCVRELCHDGFPKDFLKQLEKLDFIRCVELDSTLFRSKLELSNLKSIQLMDCSMTSLFHLSTAQSVELLESLCIGRCSKLKCLISDYERSTENKEDDHQAPNQKNHHSLFPKLKFLEVYECHELELVLPMFPCKELESVKIHGCNELIYIFGQCPNEGGLYQMEKEIILPLLQEIEIAKVPKFINIYPEYHLLQPSQVQKSWGPLCCLSSKTSALNIDELSFSKANRLDHTQASKEKHLNKAVGLFTPPLYPYKSLRKMTIKGFSELKSLLTLSIASSLELLEELIIRECDELEHIVTDEGHVYNHMNDCFIFSNLKRVIVSDAEKLKYLFGKCHSSQKHNAHVAINLRDLKLLRLDNVPNMVGICTKNYSVKALSLRSIFVGNCPQLPINTVVDLSVDVQERDGLSVRKEKGKKGFTCSHVIKASEVKSVSGIAHGYFPPPLYQFNLRWIQIHGFSQLASLFTISMASSLKLLEILTISEFDTLEHIITDDGPNSHAHHRNVHPIFPKLQQVDVWKCNNLEYVFPAFYSKDFKDLKSVTISGAKKMKYVFGKCHADPTHNVQSELHLLALKELYLCEVPNMVSIWVENYYPEVLYLEDIIFEGCPKLPKTFIEFLVGGQKLQGDLSWRKAFSFKEKGKALSNMQELPDSRGIYMGPKHFLGCRNLKELQLVGCKQLKFILSASTMRSVPELRTLSVSDCEELVSIIEDDEENQQSPLDPHHQECFQKLRLIVVRRCKKLKRLFSIFTCPKLPKLLMLFVEDAPELVQVFECKHDAPRELVIKDVFPNLLAIRLVNLPSLHTIYEGIDFRTVKFCFVRDCNNIPSANVSSSELFEYVKVSLPQEKMNFSDDDYDLANEIISGWADMRKDEEAEEADLERDKTRSEQNSSTSDLAHNEEAPKETVEKDYTMSKQKRSLQNLTKIEEEGSQEDIREDSTMTQQNNGSPNFENNLKANFEEGPSFDKYDPASSSIYSKPKIGKPCTLSPSKESMGDERALEERRSFNNEVPQSVETSNEMALTIPPAITTTFPITSISSPKTPQIVALATQVEKELGSSTITDQTAQVKAECNGNFYKPLGQDCADKLAKVDENLKATFEEGPFSEKYDKASSSTYSKQKIEKPCALAPSKENLVHKASSSTPCELTISNWGTSASIEELCGKESMGDQQALGESGGSNEAPQRVEKPTHECSSKETSNEAALAIPPSITTPITSISSSKKSQTTTLATQVEKEPMSPSIADQTAQAQIRVNQRETSIEDDLIRLFRIMRDSSDLEVGLPYVSNIAAFEDDKVAMAFADIDSLLKIDLNQIGNSKEHTHRLENALNFLSTHFSKEEPSSHGLVRGKIEYLCQEIQRILSSFKQAYDSLDTFTKLKEKEKWIDEQHSQRMEAATTLVCKIRNTKDDRNKLKEHISRLQAELKRKEKEFEDCETKLSCLEKERKEFVLETIGFMEEYESVKKNRSYVEDDQTKASQELRKLEDQWPSCMANLRKTALLLGILVQQKP